MGDPSSPETIEGKHIYVKELENRHGTWEETELRCPETGSKQMGDIDHWSHCPFCGAEL